MSVVTLLLNRMTPRWTTDTVARGLDLFGVGRYTALGLAGVYATLIWAAAMLSFRLAGVWETLVPEPIWALGWYALAVYVCWWLVYYGFSERPETLGDGTESEAYYRNLWEETVRYEPVVTLRTYLEFNTQRGVEREEGQGLADKAADTVNAVGAIVGFSLIVFSLTIEFLITGISDLSTATVWITEFVLLCQIVAVSNFLVSVDALDTTRNQFHDHGDKTMWGVRRMFYVRGIKTYYRGLMILVFSIFLLTMVVSPLITVVGIAVFVMLGFEYWFGYSDR